MSDKTLWQIADVLRGSLPVWDGESLSELILKLMLWRKLIRDGAIQENDTFLESFVESADKTISTLANKGMDTTLLKQAFEHDKWLKNLDAHKLDAAVRLISDLDKVGKLKSIDPINLILLHQNGKRDGLWLPLELSTLMVDLAEISENDNVYVCWDDAGALSQACAEKTKNISLETPRRSAMPALVSLLIDSKFKISFSDPIRNPSYLEEGGLVKFDKSIADIPFGQKYDKDITDTDFLDRFPEKTTSSNILGLRHLIAQTNGRIVLMVSLNMLFSSGAEKTLREDILKQGILETVISMPGGSLLNTQIPYAILILDSNGGHDTVKFINADVDRFKKKSYARVELVNMDELREIALTQKSNDFSETVSVNEILENDAQLTVTRYVLPEEDKKLLEIISSSETTNLESLVALIGPPRSLKKDQISNSIDVKELGPSDMPLFGYVKTPGKVIETDKDVAYKSFLKPLDIVLVSKGSVGKVGIVPEDFTATGHAWAPGQSTNILRVRDVNIIDPRALFMLLRSQIGQGLLKTLATGATIPLIKLSDLRKLKVPLPSQEDSNAAIKAFNKECEIQKTIDGLKKEQKLISSNIWGFELEEKE